MSGGLIVLVAVFGTTVLVLFALVHNLGAARWRRSIAWGLLLGLMLVAGTIARPWGAWWRIGATWAATYLGFKALLLLHWPAAALAGLTWWRYLGFTIGWVGMDVAPWIHAGSVVPGTIIRQRLVSGGVLLVLGSALVLLFVGLPLPEPWHLVQAWCAFTAGVVALFFGFTRVLAGTWNALGRTVAPVFNQPVYASSLSDWWGKRWNLSVHTVLTIAIWQPLRERIGPTWALVAVFVASGLLHEYLLSYPAGGGWGGPTTYFALQAAGMYAERQRSVRRQLRRHWWSQTLWTLGFTLIPAPLLFHPPLLRALLGAVIDV